MNRGERRRQAKDDDKVIRNGIDPISPDPHPTAAMARTLAGFYEQAKRRGNIDPPVVYLYSKIDATLKQLGDVPVACKSGCSHCCYIWVSASAPEILHVSKLVRAKGRAAIERVKAAHIATKDYSFDTRDQHPHPCPLLEDDKCSIYANRPSACRQAASADAEICARSYHNVTNEDIPTPMVYLASRSVYAIAKATALKKVDLPYHAYEFNAALACALDNDHAEQDWLGGNDIFADVQKDPEDIFSLPETLEMYKYAFGEG